jgi:glycosyltransferase involved in cell wall biosynthesis
VLARSELTVHSEAGEGSLAVDCRKRMPLSVIVPVYNEGENFPALHSALAAGIPCPFEVYIIYDFDEDNTIPEVKRAIAAGGIAFHLVKNTVRPGVVGALETGFRNVRHGPVLVVMGDVSDDLIVVERMLELYRQGFHVVAGSRYMPGGRLVGGPFLKRNLSRWAGISLHLFRGLPTHDATNTFKLYDAEMLNALKLESRAGFEMSLEITVKAFLAGYRIGEVPSTWRDRTHGASRFRMWKWLPNYLRWYFHAFRPRSKPQAREVAS